MARKMPACPVLALPAKEVWDHQHEAQLGHRIILVYNMSIVYAGHSISILALAKFYLLHAPSMGLC